MNRLSGILMVTGGLIPLVVGIGHLFLPRFGFEAEILAQFDPETRAHFVELALYAIASFLLAFAGLSFYFAGHMQLLTSRIFAFVMSAVWLVRAALEVMFPVEISLFGMKDLSFRIIVISLVAAVLYFMAGFHGIRSSVTAPRATDT